MNAIALPIPGADSPRPVQVAQDRLIRMDEVERLTGLKKSTIYNNLRVKGGFPRPLRLGARAVAWRESEVQAWIAARTKTGGANDGA